MTFHYYDIIIRPIDPEIKIDFDRHEFSPFQVLERGCEKRNFGNMIFKNRFLRHVGWTGMNMTWVDQRLT